MRILRFSPLCSCGARFRGFFSGVFFLPSCPLMYSWCSDPRLVFGPRGVYLVEKCKTDRVVIFELRIIPFCFYARVSIGMSCARCFDGALRPRNFRESVRPARTAPGFRIVRWGFVSRNTFACFLFLEKDGRGECTQTTTRRN